MADRLRIAILKSRRVAVDLDSALDGGSIHVFKQAEALCGAGHDVHIFTRGDGSIHEPPQRLKCGALVWRVPFELCPSSDILERDFREGASFVRGVLSSPAFAYAAFDILHIHHWTSGVGLIECIPDRLPLAFTPHLLASEKARTGAHTMHPSIARHEQELLSRANIVIALSSSEAANCSTLGSEHVEIVPNGVSEQFFAIGPPIRPMPGAPLRLGSIGRICRQKGTDILLDAIEILIDGGIDVQLDIVGPSYGEERFEREIRQRVLQFPLSGRVHLLGPVSHTNLPLLVKKWDLYVQPSRYESQGIALLEAMAAARIVVATDVQAVAEYVNSATGVLAPWPPTGTAFAAAVIEATTNLGWASMTGAARDSARRFSWQATTTRLNDILGGAVASSRWRGLREDPAAAHALLEAAKIATSKIVEDSIQSTVLLIGSSARGPARPGSDVDLLVIQDDEFSLRQDWRFTKNAPVDVRIVSVKRLHELCNLSDLGFAAAIVNDVLPDLLCGAVPLTDVSSPLGAAIERVQNRRREVGVTTLSANELGKRARIAFDAAQLAVQLQAPVDAQLKLNEGVQLLLQAALVAQGWIVQGAKRRLEAAVDYATRFEEVRCAVGLLTSAVGIDCLTNRQVAQLISARSQLRIEQLRCLERLGAARELVDVARRHAMGATDYYSAAIADGFVKGSVNHLRALSGVPIIPSTYVGLLQFDKQLPCRDFLINSAVDASVKELWLTIMAPQSASIIMDLASRGIALTRQYADEPTSENSTTIH